jgi:hypothetical protein
MHSRGEQNLDHGDINISECSCTQEENKTSISRHLLLYAENWSGMVLTQAVRMIRCVVRGPEPPPLFLPFGAASCRIDRKLQEETGRGQWRVERKHTDTALSGRWQAVAVAPSRRAAIWRCIMMCQFKCKEFQFCLFLLLPMGRINCLGYLCIMMYLRMPSVDICLCPIHLF